MADLKMRLERSKAAALAAKEAFKSRYVEGRGDRSVGIGLNRARDDWAVKVFVRSASGSIGLPERFRDFEVDVEVTGPVEAFANP